MAGFYTVIDVHYYGHLEHLKLDKYKKFLDTFTIQNSEEQAEVEHFQLLKNTKHI